VRRFFTLCTAIAIERVLELAWSSRRRAPRENIFPWMVALHAGTLVAAPLEARLMQRRPVRAAWIALGAATALRIWMLASLRRSWSVRVVRPPRIVTRGPYRFIRHPNYLAVIVELAALPLAGGAWVTALLASAANTLLLQRRIPYEEKLLFGDRHYRRHFGKLPRFIPRWR
jgi:methyltransferase